jgi:hypothetical protein
MNRTAATTDDRLLARLHAPPDLHDGVESLAYWHDRRRRLSWHRLRARREAARMIGRWEERVGGALLSQAGVPIATRASAGLLLARIRLLRWGRRCAIAVVAIVGLTVMVAPIVAAALLLNAVF